MDWMEKMNASIEYIERNLDGELDLSQAARISKCSQYHFQRVFAYMANVTLSEYIRRRRLTLAAFDLQGGGEKVIDVALKYGYESPTSFARAFQNLHGMSPSEAKTGNKKFVSYPPISFQIIIKGVSSMKYQIKDKDAFRVIGVKLSTTMEDDKCLKEIPVFWDKTVKDGMIEKLGKYIKKDPVGMLGICDGSMNKQEFEYYIGVAADEPLGEGMLEFTVPAAKWAIFEGEGPMPSSIQDLTKRTITEWLPNSGYDMDMGPDIELYLTPPGESVPKFEVWIPVKKK